MNLMQFTDVHPNWDILRRVSPDTSRAIAELSLISLRVDGETPYAAAEVAADAYKLLPTGKPHAPVEIMRLAREVASLEAHQSWSELLDHLAARIEDPEVRIAALRLVAILLAVDGATEREQALAYAIGQAFDVDYDIVEDILRAAWESQQQAVKEAQGESVDVPPVMGAAWARDRGTAGWGLPPLVPKQHVSGAN